MKMIILHIDPGACRVVYKLRLNNTYYCLQNEGECFGGIKLYRCSKDFEPNYEVQIRNESDWVGFQVPKGNLAIEKEIRRFLALKGALKNDTN